MPSTEPRPSEARSSKTSFTPLLLVKQQILPVCAHCHLPPTHSWRVIWVAEVPRRGSVPRLPSHLFLSHRHRHRRNRRRHHPPCYHRPMTRHPPDNLRWPPRPCRQVLPPHQAPIAAPSPRPVVAAPGQPSGPPQSRPTVKAARTAERREAWVRATFMFIAHAGSMIVG